LPFAAHHNTTTNLVSYGVAKETFGLVMSPCKSCTKNLKSDPGSTAFSDCTNPAGFGYSSEGANQVILWRRSSWQCILLILWVAALMHEQLLALATALRVLHGRALRALDGQAVLSVHCLLFGAALTTALSCCKL
jgi:hypothetical protein